MASPSRLTLLILRQFWQNDFMLVFIQIPVYLFGHALTSSVYKGSLVVDVLRFTFFRAMLLFTAALFIYWGRNGIRIVKGALELGHALSLCLSAVCLRSDNTNLYYSDYVQNKTEWRHKSEFGAQFCNKIRFLTKVGAFFACFQDCQTAERNT